MEAKPKLSSRRQSKRQRHEKGCKGEERLRALPRRREGLACSSLPRVASRRLVLDSSSFAGPVVSGPPNSVEKEKELGQDISWAEQGLLSFVSVLAFFKRVQSFSVCCCCDHDPKYRCIHPVAGPCWPGLCAGAFGKHRRWDHI